MGKIKKIIKWGEGKEGGGVNWRDGKKKKKKKKKKNDGSWGVKVGKGCNFKVFNGAASLSQL